MRLGLPRAANPLAGANHIGVEFDSHCSPPSTTQIYTHIVNEDVKRAMQG